MRTTLSGLLLTIIAGCSEAAPPDTPEGVYRAFYQAAAGSDWDRAMTHLSGETLQAFRTAGSRLLGFAGVRDDPLQYFLRGIKGERTMPLQSVEVVSRGEGEAQLKVTAGPCGEGAVDAQCSITQITVRREQGRWVLCPELPDPLRPISVQGGVR